MNGCDMRKAVIVSWLALVVATPAWAQSTEEPETIATPEIGSSLTLKAKSKDISSRSTGAQATAQAPSSRTGQAISATTPSTSTAAPSVSTVGASSALNR